MHCLDEHMHCRRRVRELCRGSYSKNFRFCAQLNPVCERRASIIRSWLDRHLTPPSPYTLQILTFSLPLQTVMWRGTTTAFPPCDTVPANVRVSSNTVSLGPPDQNIHVCLAGRLGIVLPFRPPPSIMIKRARKKPHRAQQNFCAFP